MEKGVGKRALSGLRVIDLGHVVAVPLCTMFLADLGAEVIHVEPFSGDDARGIGPFVGPPDKNRSGFFISLNRNKKSLCLDIKKDEGKKILRSLIGAADILIDNFRPGVMERLGFSRETVREINPRVISASITGFGHDALPGYETRPAYDMVAQAYSGLMSITGPEGGPSCRVGVTIGDFIAGHQAAIGILAALHWREKTGRGQDYDGSMVDGLFSILENAAVRYTIDGTVAKPLGSASAVVTPFQGFPTRDSSVVTPIANDALWEKFCRVLGREDLRADPRFQTNYLRTRHRAELIPLLDAVFREKTTLEWITLFDAADLPCSPINDMRQICEDPHIRHRRMLVDIEQPLAGPMRIAGSPLRLSETPGEVYAPAPALGQHSEEVLREVLGYSPDTIRRLFEDGVVRGPEPVSS